ncbi:MAG: signal peptide peptidase SppA [Candidatus Paceibacterota bacterium]|jgi:signal peptide peptidase SppA
MKKLNRKINELWQRYRNWGKSSFVGDFTVSTMKIVFIAIAFLAIFQILSFVDPSEDKEQIIEDSSLVDSSEPVNDNCTVAGINIHGKIVTYVPEHAENDSLFDYDITASENVFWLIKSANGNEKIKAILVEVDSSGGYPVAGEEISNAIKNSEKPIIGFIRETGASAGYWAISSADKIFASKNSEVGGIGVTMSYLNNVEKNKKDGYLYEQLSAGKFKDAGNTDKPLTKEEKDLFMRDLNILYENFIEAVSQNRGLSVEAVKKFADGSTVLGDKAKELGMIDEIGGINEVEKYLEELIEEKPEICWE